MYDSIIRKEEFDRWHPPLVEPGICLVIFREGNDPYIRLEPGHRLSRCGLFLSKCKFTYTIDMTEHLVEFDCKLPSKDEVPNFRVHAHVFYSVADPILVIKRNINDARSVLQPVIESKMRSITRQYDANQGLAAAEEKIMDEVKGLSFDDIGLRVDRCIIKLDK